MKANRFIVTILSAAALIAASACRSSSATKTTTTSSTTTVTQPSTAYGTTSMASADNNGTVVTDQSGTNVTKTTTTTTIYRNGQVVTTDANGNTIASTDANAAQASSSATTTAPTLPAGAAVVVTTTTTTKSTPAVVSASASASGNQAPMTSSTQVYGTTNNRTFFGHRYPSFDILAFADRATFSDNNRAINGSLNTGPLSTSLRGENGWGVGFNAWFGSRFSAEFTGSRIRPRATFTPTNAAFNPITGLRIRMTPITGAFQIHFMPHASIDPYIGGGAEYVTFHADRGFNPGTSGLTSVNIRDEWGPMVQAGLRLGNAHGLSFNVDGKYSWIRARAESTFDNATLGNVGNSSRLGVNPLILSAGIRLGF